MAERGWRITTINGLLLAAYIVPVWTIAALRIVIYPMRGIYERSNVGPTLYFSDAFQFSTLGTVRLAWLLVVAKLVVVTFFFLFSFLTFKGKDPQRADGDEALALALLIGSILSVASMLAASAVGEASALRLHATESLMLLGGFALLVIDSHSYGVKRREDVVADGGLVARPAV